MHTLPRERNAAGALDQTSITSLRANPAPSTGSGQALSVAERGGNLDPGVHTLCCQYVKDSSDSPREDFGRWACSSNNHQSSIILHQFPSEPICMIEAAGDYAGTYYYHFDALGSVVALTDADADDVQKYDYSVWGQVGAWDADHPNPYLFTGRRFDTETGLYYYRARYYHPEIGRFLQTDPVRYEAGMNLYRYCVNNPANLGDPGGCQAKRKSPPNYYRELECPTGNVLILPYRLDPGMLQESERHQLFWEIASKVFDKITPDSPITEWIGMYFDILERSPDLAIALATYDRAGWRVFIEVETVIISTDKDGNPQPPKRMNQRWIEVNHLEGWVEELPNVRAGGYGTWEDAVKAAQKGFSFYFAYENMGKQPDNTWFHDKEKHQMYGPETHAYSGQSMSVVDLTDPETGKTVPPPAVD